MPSHEAPAEIIRREDGSTIPDQDPPSADNAELPRIQALPREVGAMLLSVGVLGWILPGMAGTPALIAGGLVLWPNTFRKVDAWFQRRYPVLHKQSMRQVSRYLDDLERRYSDPKPGV